MSLPLDVRYARQLNLEQFSETQKNYFNFRCPICGDSAKSKTKKRGWLIPTQDKQGLFFNCFNCSASMSMSFFIYKVDAALLKIYNRDKFEEANGFVKTRVEEKPKIEIKSETVKNIISVIKLPCTHGAYQYLEKRKVEKKYWDEIYYTDNYKKWVVENYLPDKYKHTGYEDHRIVFPLYTTRGELIGFQGRSLNPDDDIRFLTVKIRETDYPVCYGLNKLSILEPYIFIVEGIFDSLVLNNSIAMLKSNINLKFVMEHLDYKNVIFIFDNEPRNREIVKNYDRIASVEDFGLFIWPKNIGVKDLNELAVKNNWDQNTMVEFIKKNTIFGKLRKMLQLSNWKIL
jgi:transcription elongation factor Elf1